MTPVLNNSQEAAARLFFITITTFYDSVYIELPETLEHVLVLLRAQPENAAHSFVFRRGNNARNPMSLSHTVDPNGRRKSHHVVLTLRHRFVIVPAAEFAQISTNVDAMRPCAVIFQRLVNVLELL